MAYAEFDNYDIIERLLTESNDNAEEVRHMLNLIGFYSDNQIPLLEASISEITMLPTINYTEARKIKNYISRNAEVNLVRMCRELDFSPLQKEIILDCTVPSFGKIRKYRKSNYCDVRSISEVPFEESKGIKTGKYEGTNYSENVKFRGSVSNYNFGISTDKDIGERSLIDYYGFYLFKNFGKYDVAIGDFKASSGLGLVLGDGFGGSKYSYLVYSDPDINNKITPYLSSYNSHIFRGLALQGNFPFYQRYKLTTSLFVSDADRSATLNKDGTIRSVYDGYYRTTTEIAKKNNVSEKTVGGNIGLTARNFSFVYTAYFTEFDRSVDPTNNAIYKGKNNMMQSLSGAFNYGSLSLAAEIAAVKSYSAIQINGKYNLKLDEIRLFFRDYSSDFSSYYGRNFFENNYVYNERGIGGSYIHKFTQKLTGEYAADFYKLPDSTSNYNPQEINGYDLETRLFLAVNNNNDMDLRIKYESKEQVNKGNLDANQAIKTRFGWNCRFTKKLNGGVRCDFIYLFPNSNIDESRGGAIFVDLTYKHNSKLSLKTKIGIYNTTDYGSAVWIINSLTSSTMHFVSMYLKGIYGEFSFDWRIFKAMTIASMYSINYKPDVTTLKSGYDMIDKNFEQKIWLVLKYNIKQH